MGAPKKPMVVPRSSGGTFVKISVIASGIRTPELNPWIMRNRISESVLQEIPQNIDPSRKPISAPMKILFTPNLVIRNVASGALAAMANK